MNVHNFDLLFLEVVKLHVYCLLVIAVLIVSNRVKSIHMLIATCYPSYSQLQFSQPFFMTPSIF